MLLGSIRRTPADLVIRWVSETWNRVSGSRVVRKPAPEPTSTTPTRPIVVHRRPRPSIAIEIDELSPEEEMKCRLYWLGDGEESSRSFRKLDDGRVEVECVVGKYHFGPTICESYSEAQRWLVDATEAAAETHR